MKRGPVNLLIIAIILVGLSIGCDGFSRISGHVYDSDERPISDALVVFEAVEKGKPEDSYRNSYHTDHTGRFGVGFVHAPWNVALRLSVKKEGYKPFVLDLDAKQAHEMIKNNHELKVVLEKE